MATVGQVYYNIMDKNSGSPISTAGIDIFQDIIAQMNADKFTKLGVQAPPGTRVVMNGSKTIMVGRTGMYELDEDVVITSIYFVRPRQYIKDEAASELAKQEGIDGMIAANEARQRELDRLNNDYAGNIPTNEEQAGYKEYWERYNAIQSLYINDYKEALNSFNTGSNGIYVLPDPNNPESEVNYKDLFNIIIDFIYE